MKRAYIITGIIILLLIAGGLLVWQKAVKAPGGDINPPVIPMPTPPLVTPMPPAPPISQTPEGWKTYENKEFGFAFDYPGEWEIEESEGMLNYESLDGEEKGFIRVCTIEIFNPTDRQEVHTFVKITAYPSDKAAKGFRERLKHSTGKITLPSGVEGEVLEAIGIFASFFSGNTSIGFVSAKKGSAIGARNFPLDMDIVNTFRLVK